MRTAEAADHLVRSQDPARKKDGMFFRILQDKPDYALDV